MYSENASQKLEIKLREKEIIFMKERIRNTIKYINFYKSNNAIKRKQNNSQSENVDELLKALETNIDIEELEK